MLIKIMLREKTTKPYIVDCVRQKTSCFLKILYACQPRTFIFFMKMKKKHFPFPLNRETLFGTLKRLPSTRDPSSHLIPNAN